MTWLHFGDVMLRVFVALALAVVVAVAVARVSSASTLLGADYGLYCINGRLVVDRRDIEELKNLYKADVCCLDQDPCASGILDKIHRLGGPGAVCACH